MFPVGWLRQTNTLRGEESEIEFICKIAAISVEDEGWFFNSKA
jgi:hypothetical protein